MTQTPTFIDTKDVARRLGKTPRTVQRMVKAGLLKPAMVAPGAGQHGAFMFDPADVEALLS